jgi:hypothetical protein
MRNKIDDESIYIIKYDTEKKTCHSSSLIFRLPPTPAVIRPPITPPIIFSILIFCGSNYPSVSKSKPPPSPISYESNSCHSLISGQYRLLLRFRCHGIDGSHRSSIFILKQGVVFFKIVPNE